MKPLRIIIAEDEPVTRKDLIEMLQEEKIITIGECGDGLTAVNLAKNLKPDLIIMDIKMPIMDGIEAAQLLNKEKIAPVMLLTAYSQGELIERAKNAGVLAYLVKPVNKQSLIPACYIAVSRYEEFNILAKENKNLMETLGARKTIEKAKGILEKQYLMDEEAAFRKIRTISMNQRKTMKEVAEAIIMTLE
jgi:two-component system, response regulator PdtaR